MPTPAPVDRAVRPRLGSMLLGKRAEPKAATEELDLLELTVAAKGLEGGDGHSVFIRASIDTGAHMNIVSANWMPLLRLAGAVEMPVERPMDVEWVTGVTFPVVGRTMLNVSFLHAETVSKTMELLICPPGVGGELVIGWGHI